ncbi:MAG: hypothetical protein KBD44_00140 [Candidatus Pacebacteria bacterium]|nr:hypothetical protein [Candidatus Paceibacterota bacterium]
MNRFRHCHESDGLMWCQHHNGSWAPPFTASPVDSNGAEKETPTAPEEK